MRSLAVRLTSNRPACVCRYLECMAGRKWPTLAGTAFLASAPHTGNNELVKRIMRAMPLKSVAITWGVWTALQCSTQ